MRKLPWLSLLFAVAASAQPAADIAARVARWKPVPMPLRAEGLSARDRRMLDRLVEACRLLNDVYWRQSDTGGLALYLGAKDPDVRQLFGINGSRWDLIDGKPFFGVAPEPPGHDFYPHDLTVSEIEHYAASHPAEKEALYSGFTVVRRAPGGKLVAVPYHEEYRAFLQPMAQALRDAASLSGDASFAAFLRLRAGALLTDDYYRSDLAWVDLKDPKIDVIFAPYETYLDGLLGVKTSYGASILIRNEAESRKLAVYQQYVPRIQDALPLDPADRPSKAGQPTPMEVMDAPWRAGDLRYGYQAVADNLPNDPRIHQEKGTKKIFFKNFMDARVDNVIVPISRRLMQPAQAARVTGEGTMAFAVMHEISHGLGPAYSRMGGRQVDIREALGPVYGGLEEAKADVTGMYALHWLVDQGALPKQRLEEYDASYVGGIFRTLRFGTGEAHGRAMLMEFNFLAESGALKFAAGRCTIDYGRMPQALAAVTKQLLTFEARGDRAGAEAWFTRYGSLPAELRAALDLTRDIPVDISPVFSFPDNLK